MNTYNVETGQTVGGNYGLHDQLMAIQFIHENKANLGVSRITLNGESAGAASGTSFLRHSSVLVPFSFINALER